MFESDLNKSFFLTDWYIPVVYVFNPEFHITIFLNHHVSIEL